MRTLLALAPLVAFYVVESTWGLRPAVVAGLIAALVELGWTRWAEGRWSKLSLVGAALVVGLGGMSLLSDDPRFVLWSPVFGDLLFAGLLVGARLMGASPIRAALEEQDPELDLHPLQARWLDGLAWRFAAVLLVHAGAIAWAIPRDRETWLAVSGPGGWVVLGLAVAAEVAYARFVVLPRVEADEAEAAGDR